MKMQTLLLPLTHICNIICFPGLLALWKGERSLATHPQTAVYYKHNHSKPLVYVTACCIIPLFHRVLSSCFAV